MKILAIDTSSKICSVALLEDTNVLMEKHSTDEKTHSQKLMPLIEQLLKENHIELSDIDLFACSNGPGSFTGVRIAVSTIKAFADVEKKPVVPVSSLEGLAYNAQSSYFKDESNLVCTMIDAKNDNVYFALFARTKTDDFEVVEHFDAKNIEIAISMLKEKYDDEPIIFIGDGCVNHKYKILQELPKSIFVVDALNKQTSISIGKCGYYKYKQGIYGDSNFLSPLYLRKSQAERALDGEK